MHIYIPVLAVVGTLLLGTKEDNDCCGTVTGIGVSFTVTGTNGATSSSDSITFKQSVYT